jgi:predicted dithiol-disulfide oxidoreductase (DUF899 family)
MTTRTIAHPPIVSHDEWLAARKELLAREKEITRARDELNAARRRLPMVRLEKDYRLVGSDGEVGFSDLFEGRRQLVIYHFMFDPRWDAGCPTCTRYVDAIGDLSKLRALRMPSWQRTRRTAAGACRGTHPTGATSITTFTSPSMSQSPRLSTTAGA